MTRTCSTIDCENRATHRVTYSFPEARAHIISQDVCRGCGIGYLQRPGLMARLKPLLFDDQAITDIELSKLHDVLCHAWNFGRSPLAAEIDPVLTDVEEEITRRLAEVGTSIKSEL
jgi:hypothetical protein